MSAHPSLRLLALLLMSIGFGISDAEPQLGNEAPEVRLQDQNGKWHQLKDYRGQWVVLYFYAKDQTPGCTVETREFAALADEFRQLNASVLGVSIDDVASHRKFAEKYALPFPILADPSRDTVNRYEVLSFTGYAKRETFLIDPQGRIVKHYLDVDPKTHADVVLQELTGLQKK